MIRIYFLDEHFGTDHANQNEFQEEDKLKKSALARPATHLVGLTMLYHCQYRLRMTQK